MNFMKRVFLSLAVMVLAVASLQAQSSELSTLYNEAVTAWSEKDYPSAATKFSEVIEKGMDEEGAASLVTTARKQLPLCYYQIGGRAMQAKQYDAAIENFTKSAELAELYDDVTTMSRANTWIGKVYQTQGGTAFNEKNYVDAIEPFSLGYAADPRNTDMAQWLGISYCEVGEYDKGMEVFSNIVAMGSNSRYAEAAAEAQSNIELYTNNKIAAMQGEGDIDAIIAFADGLLEKDPTNALAAKIRLQALLDKKDYAGVAASADAAAELQTNDDERSNVYFILAASYNAREMRDQAIAAFNKVTSGVNAEAAAAAVKELTTAN